MKTENRATFSPSTQFGIWGRRNRTYEQDKKLGETGPGSVFAVVITARGERAKERRIEWDVVSFGSSENRRRLGRFVIGLTCQHAECRRVW